MLGACLASCSGGSPAGSPPKVPLALTASIAPSAQNPLDTLTAATAAQALVGLTLSADASAQDDVEVELGAGGALVSASAAAPAGGGALSIGPFDATPLGEGPVTLSVRITAHAGGQSASRVQDFGAPFLKDTLPPVLPSAAQVASGAQNAAGEILPSNVAAVVITTTWPATAAGDESAWVELSTAGASVSSAPLSGPAGGGTLDYAPLDATTLDEGMVSITVHASDPVGNTDMASGTPAFKDARYVLLSSDRPLEKSVLLASAGAGLSGFALSSALLGLAPTGAAPSTATAGALPALGSGQPGSAASASAGSGSSAWDALVPWTAHLSLTTANFANGSGGCAVLAPYDSATCDLALGIDLDRDVAPDGIVAGAVSATVSDAADPLDLEISEALPTHEFALRQLTNNVTNTFQGQWTALGQRLYFRAQASNAKDKLFYYDDAAGSARLLLQMAGTNQNDAVNILGAHWGYLFLNIRNNSSQRKTKLVRYVPSPESVRPVSEIRPNGNEGPAGATVYGNHLYFSANRTGSVRKLYRYSEDASGAPLAIEQISDTAGGAGVNDEPGTPIVYAGALYFASRKLAGETKLFRYDEAGAGVVEQVSDIAQGPNLDDAPTMLTLCGGKLYLSALNSSGAAKLHAYDAATGSLEVLSDTRSDPTLTDGPQSATVDEDQLYFVANIAAGITKVFVHDSTAGALAQVSDCAGSGAADAPSAVVCLSGKAFFSARNALGARKLFAFDPATGQVEQLSNLSGDPALTDDPDQLAVYGGKLFFRGLLAAGVQKLFVHDPATGWLSQVSSTSGSNATTDSITVIGEHFSKLFFLARTPGNRIELFSLCDRSTGCTDDD